MIHRKEIKDTKRYYTDLTFNPQGVCDECGDDFSQDTELNIKILSKLPIELNDTDPRSYFIGITSEVGNVYGIELYNHIKINEENLNSVIKGDTKRSIVDREIANNVVYRRDSIYTHMARASLSDYINSNNDVECPSCACNSCGEPGIEIRRVQHGISNGHREGYIGNNEVGINMDDISILVQFTDNSVHANTAFPDESFKETFSGFIGI